MKNWKWDMTSPRDPLSSLIVLQGSFRILRQLLSLHVDESALRLGKVGAVYVETDEWDPKVVGS